MGGERGGREFEIAQLLVGFDGAHAFAESDAVKRSEIIAKMLALRLKLEGIAGDRGHQQKMLPDRPKPAASAGLKHFGMHQRQRVAELERCAEGVGGARKRRDTEGVAFGNRIELESGFGNYSERSERSGHHLHQIIAGHVFDHPAAAMHRAAFVADEAHSDQQVARRALGKPQGAGLGRANQRAERGCAGAARIERQALAMLGQALD